MSPTLSRDGAVGELPCWVCVWGGGDPGLEGSRESSPSHLLTPLGLGPGGLGKWAWPGCQELEAGVRPAPLPGSLGPVSSGCFQAGPAQGRGSGNREPVSKQRFKGLSSRAPAPLLWAAIDSTLSVSSVLLIWAKAQRRDLSPWRFYVSPPPQLEAVPVLGMWMDGHP